jgi:hypothetical protein
LRSFIDNRNLEHVVSSGKSGKRNARAKTELGKLLKALIETKPPEPGVEECRNQSRHLSSSEPGLDTAKERELQKR